MTYYNTTRKVKERGLVPEETNKDIKDFFKVLNLKLYVYHSCSISTWEKFGSLYYHFAVTWDAETKTKKYFLDGNEYNL